MKVDDSFRWNVLQLRVQEQKIAAALRLFRENGLEPLLFKGWAIARLYPRDQPRPFFDIDLAVPPGDFDKAITVSKTPAGRMLNLDLHRGFRHFDRRPWAEIFEAAELYELEGTTVRTPSAEDHLRLLAAHWLNDGGAEKERLWDIYYSVVNRPQSFDWDRCLNAAGPERRTWVVYAIAMAHQYLGLPIDDLPIRDQIPAIPEWMRRTVEGEWESGVRLRDLHTCFGDWRLLATQIRKRVPPNPIQATIEMEKSLDDPRQRYFQARTFVRRSLPSIGKLRFRLSGNR